MKIVLITRDRPELTKQTIETMKANADNWNNHRLVVVFDCTSEETVQIFPEDVHTSSGNTLVGTKKQLGVGGAKNYGVKIFEDQGLSDDDIIMFSDNDMYYLPEWDSILEYALSAKDPVTQLGGWKHPYHQSKQLENYRFCTNDNAYELLEVDAITGNCFVIRYSDWKKYGPFDANALGPGQSEDYAFSQKIKMAGGIVATLDPPVAIHCGLANCLGQSATGWQEMSQMAEKQIEENNIDKIWLAVPEEGTILLEKINNVQNFKGCNVGSGQRRFDNTKGWFNIDSVSRPGQVPDLVLDATKLDTKFEENSQDMVVLHHVLEHFGCGEADEVIKQCYKVLRPGGSLLIFVPDLRKLAGRWLSGELEDFLFLVNVYGAYMGEGGDRHKWGYSEESLIKYLKIIIPLTCNSELRFPLWEDVIKPFDWREIPGADIAQDWWILGMEVIK